MKNNNKQSGISLIALIVIIVVLIILAAVSVTTITNDGVLDHAKNQEDKIKQELSERNFALQNHFQFLNKTN